MMRTLEITNIYEMYPEEVTTIEVDLLSPADFLVEPSAEEYSEYLYDKIYPLTGVGHEDGNSAYFIVSTDGLVPVINEEY